MRRRDNFKELGLLLASKVNDVIASLEVNNEEAIYSTNSDITIEELKQQKHNADMSLFNVQAQAQSAMDDRDAALMLDLGCDGATVVVAQKKRNVHTNL